MLQNRLCANGHEYVFSKSDMSYILSKCEKMNASKVHIQFKYLRGDKTLSDYYKPCEVIVRVAGKYLYIIVYGRNAVGDNVYDLLDAVRVHNETFHHNIINVAYKHIDEFPVNLCGEEF